LLFSTIPAILAGTGDLQDLTAQIVSGNYFDVLGAPAGRGRVLVPADDSAPGASAAAVISTPYWERTFASDPAVVGRTLLVNGHTFTIVGVSAEGFTRTDIGAPADIWIPLAMQREAGRNLLTDARTNWLELVGRLRTGQSREQAAEALNRDLRQRVAELPAQTTARTMVLVPGDKGTSPARGQRRSALLINFALSALALALACMNIACLAAVRSAGREREIAIRLAIGAGRSRLERQLLTEGFVLASFGGLAALLIAPWTARTLIAAYSTRVAIESTPDPRLLAFVGLTSLAVGVAVAIVPIIVSRHVKLTHGSETAAAATPRRRIAHDAVVTLQIAMALSMLISAALLVQSLRGFNAVDPGFRVDNLLLASLDPRTAGYDGNRIHGFWRAALGRVGSLPGVQSVSLARTVPLAPGRQRQPWLNPASGERVEIDTNFVGPRYFQTLAIPVLRGRDFDDDDGKASRPVVIVNEGFARAFWPQQEAIGKTLRLPDAAGATAEVVGVVRDVKYQNLRGDAGPMIYRATLQTRSTDAMVLHVRAATGSASLVSPIRQTVQEIDRSVPLFQLTTLEEQFEASFAETRQAAVISGTFGLLALALSGIGVYGVTALAVSRRVRDIGVRMALGAGRHHIVQAIGARVMAVIAAGICLGLLGSFAFTRVTRTLLFGVSSGDAATFASMAALLGLMSLLAFAIPVRAATRLDVVAALRRE
jgi:predicted permease